MAPRLIELFAGSCTLSHAASERGWAVCSVDLDARTPATEHADDEELCLSVLRAVETMTEE